MEKSLKTILLGQRDDPVGKDTLLSILKTLVPSLEYIWWKDRNNSSKLPSKLQMCTNFHAHKSQNKLNAKYFENTLLKVRERKDISWGLHNAFV